VDPSRIGVICSTSVWRDNLEPSVAVCVQRALGLPASCMNLDVTNACVGMMNGMLVVAGMIEAGVCEYGLVVCAEATQVRLQVFTCTAMILQHGACVRTYGSLRLKHCR
jgi:3-oxoacyl-[acyl-carrier-protein] synthase-3